MCTPAVTAISTGIGLLTNTFEQVSSYKNNVKNANYRTQIALNNAKTAQNQALIQKQLGIDESRKEKIEGLRNASRLNAKNAANGMDISSTTSMLGYRDVLDNSDSEANNIKNTYDLRANDYLKQAGGYFSEAKESKKEAQNYKLNYAMTALGETNKVAGKWLEKKYDKWV